LLVLVVSVVMALASPGQAMAAGKVSRTGAVLTVDMGTGTSDGLLVESTSELIRVTLYYQSALDVGTSGCAASVSEVTCPFAAEVDRLIVRTHDLYDEVLVPAPEQPGFVPVPAVIDVDLGGSGDLFIAEAQTEPVVVAGAGGDDRVTTGPGNDILDGGSGSDTLMAAGGRDEVVGGSGQDVVRYDDHTSSLKVSLDGQGNDGDPVLEERDNVRSDIEVVIGGTAADVLVGDAGANELQGADGDDRLEGGGGVDRFAGGMGADTILARDGLAERVACEAGRDRAVVDDIDTTSGCEVVESAADLQPDRDGDGIDAPGDCLDTAAAVRPGAFDVPDNGVDEDCSGADAITLDRDLDGFPRGLDCDDTTAKVRPGGVEVLGNGVDEDCNGRHEPFPVFEARVRMSSLVYRKRSYTAVTALLMSALGEDDRIVVRCKGKGCPIKTRRPKPPNGGGDLSYGKPFKRARLKPGAKIIVRITRADGAGAATTFRVRAAKPPKRTLVCYTPVRARVTC
jgi:hypothetical protein